MFKSINNIFFSFDLQIISINLLFIVCLNKIIKIIFKINFKHIFVLFSYILLFSIKNKICFYFSHCFMSYKIDIKIISLFIKFDKTFGRKIKHKILLNNKIVSNVNNYFIYYLAYLYSCWGWDFSKNSLARISKLYV